MSLQLAAKHLSNQGRGPDDTLVHMSRGEVKSLNDLAMAHGGQLTINPKTGLPEAGFLSMLLPMVAGAVLGPAGPVGLTALQAGLAVGAGSYLLNPKAGLMGSLSAGLGGYGGAGLGEGLANIATSEAGSTIQNIEKPNLAYAADTDAMARATLAKSQQQLVDNSVKIGEAVKLGEYQTDPNFVSAHNKGLPPISPDASVGRISPQLSQDQISQISATNADILKEQLAAAKPIPTGLDAVYKGAESLVTDPTANKFKTLGGGNYMGLAQKGLAAAAPVITQPAKLNLPTSTSSGKQVVPHYRFSPGMVSPTPAAGATGTENTYFNPSYTALSDADTASLYPGYSAAQAADGGLMGYATGGLSDARYNLGSYSDGGRLLRGPGDGVSDSIPAMIGKKQPARLADGEFVVPARIVSEIGNGSTEAGARKLYAMMDRIQAARGKTVGKGKIAKNTRADKYLPA